jgi:hypothetical protein
MMLFPRTHIDPLCSADLHETGGLKMDNGARDDVISENLH